MRVRRVVVKMWWRNQNTSSLVSLRLLHWPWCVYRVSSVCPVADLLPCLKLAGPVFTPLLDCLISSILSVLKLGSGHPRRFFSSLSQILIIYGKNSSTKSCVKTICFFIMYDGVDHLALSITFYHPLMIVWFIKNEISAFCLRISVCIFSNKLKKYKYFKIKK